MKMEVESWKMRRKTGKKAWKLRLKQENKLFDKSTWKAQRRSLKAEWREEKRRSRRLVQQSQKSPPRDDSSRAVSTVRGSDQRKTAIETDQATGALSTENAKNADLYYGDRWTRRLEELRRYKERNGHCNVPQKEGKLGVWLMTQRAQHMRWKEGRRNFLTCERRDALDDLGVEWRYKEKTDDNLWAQRLEELRRYKLKHGHCGIKKREGQLGRWADHQRIEYRKWLRGQRTFLTTERRAQLDGLGFDFCPRAKWRRKKDG